MSQEQVECTDRHGHAAIPQGSTWDQQSVHFLPTVWQHYEI